MEKKKRKNRSNSIWARGFRFEKNKKKKIVIGSPAYSFSVQKREILLNDILLFDYNLVLAKTKLQTKNVLLPK